MKEFSMIITEYLLHGLRKIEFRFQLFEMLQNEGIEQDHHRIYSAWLKKNLDFNDLKFSKMKELRTINHRICSPWLDNNLDFSYLKL